MKELIERYRKLYAGVVYDAMAFDLNYQKPFVVDRGIRQLAGPCDTLVGLAFTCRGVTIEPAFNEDACDPAQYDALRLDVFEAIPDGSVVMMRTDHDREVAHFGDISALIAKTAGAKGVVIDGYTRDVRRINEMGFSVFARGRQPIDAYGRWYLQNHSNSIGFAAHDGQSFRVYPGDLIFADGDGVLVIPQGLAADVLEAAEKRAKGEDEIRNAIKAGDSPMDIYQRLGRW